MITRDARKGFRIIADLPPVPALAFLAAKLRSAPERGPAKIGVDHHLKTRPPRALEEIKLAHADALPCSKRTRLGARKIGFLRAGTEFSS